MAAIPWIDGEIARTIWRVSFGLIYRVADICILGYSIKYPIAPLKAIPSCDKVLVLHPYPRLFYNHNGLDARAGGIDIVYPLRGYGQCLAPRRLHFSQFPSYL